ncbi:RNA polymerase sigma factor [Nannocystis sp. ILAH1]|uniref:RNA polymerase sigma factor n=1 Tax=unclassified Nannocystis TaxID=2627009 RepID=UPI0022716D95|nr:MULTISPECIES: RNA polymerase sigma factor [unclassified Nannocystis]MCY0987122.1 RNA polymerase sigma factor [Nannocystis sp. ILAH1]MCY1072005.1 RNA polymerase sigma factor [Nannocystis sp. RBIL2]
MDEDRFQALYAATHARLWAYVYRLTGERAAADDLVQDSYCRLFQLPPGRVRAGAERAYLYRIATNLVTDHHRRRTRLGARLRELLLAHEAAPPRAPEPGEGSELQAIFDRLPRRDAALLWLAYVDGHDHAEMAEILDVRPASVRVLLSRARARLADLLQNESKDHHAFPSALAPSRGPGSRD